jgi:hypothetical protein
MKKTRFSIAVMALALSGALAAQGFGDPDRWSAFDDRESKSGSSECSLTVAKETIDGAEYAAVAAEGVVTTKYQYGFAGIIFDPDDATLESLKAGTGFSFKVVGDGLSYRVRVETSDIADADYYGKIVATRKGKTVEVGVPYSKMSQEPWGARKRFDPSKIAKISFQTIGQPIKAFSFKAFDFQILK